MRNLVALSADRLSTTLRTPRAALRSALLLVLLGVGLGAIRARWLVGLALVGLFVPHAISSINYYRGVDFINSIYNTPAREVAEAIAAAHAEGPRPAAARAGGAEKLGL